MTPLPSVVLNRVKCEERQLAHEDATVASGLRGQPARCCVPPHRSLCWATRTRWWWPTRWRRWRRSQRRPARTCCRSRESPSRSCCEPSTSAQSGARRVCLSCTPVLWHGNFGQLHRTVLLTVLLLSRAAQNASPGCEACPKIPGTLPAAEVVQNDGSSWREVHANVRSLRRFSSWTRCHRTRRRTARKPRRPSSA